MHLYILRRLGVSGVGAFRAALVVPRPVACARFAIARKCTGGSRRGKRCARRRFPPHQGNGRVSNFSTALSWPVAMRASAMGDRYSGAGCGGGWQGRGLQRQTRGACGGQWRIGKAQRGELSWRRGASRGLHPCAGAQCGGTDPRCPCRRQARPRGLQPYRWGWRRKAQNALTAGRSRAPSPSPPVRFATVQMGAA